MLRLTVEANCEPVEAVLKAVAPYEKDWRDQVSILNTAVNWLKAQHDDNWVPVIYYRNPARIDLAIEGTPSPLLDGVGKS